MTINDQLGTMSAARNGRRQGIFWLLTIPHHSYVPYPLPGTVWSKGQLELAVGGFLHWQLVVAFATKKSLRQVKELFGTGAHCELTYAQQGSEEYVWKEDTRVAGTQFELGAKPFRRNCATDWEEVWTKAIEGDYLSIPANVRVQNYRTLRTIRSDFAEPLGMVRSCKIFWGATGTGKSRDAWAQAGHSAYPKDPRTKWWDGYRGQKSVVIDEYRGIIDIANLLRWLDRYPVLVEIKGGAIPLVVEDFWITSNLPPQAWWPEVDPETFAAFLRRVEVIHYLAPL